MTRFTDKVRRILRERKITNFQFEFDTGIHRSTISRWQSHPPRRAYVMAIAYYLGMTAEELVAGTDALDAWYGEGENNA